MKNPKYLVATALLFSVLLGRDCFAGADGGLTIFEMLFGGPSGRRHAREQGASKDLGSESCDQYDGIMGMVNGFFCHMEKDMGFTGVGSKTVTFQNKSIHAEIIETAQTITLGSRSVATTHIGKVWLCSSSCSSASNFSRAFYIAFQYKSDGTINRGYLVAEPGAFEGSSGTAISLLYDLGSSTSTKFVDVKAQFTGNSTTMKMRAVGTKTGSVLNVNFAMHNGTSGFRFAGATDMAASPQYFAMYYEDGGAGTGEAANGAAGTGSGTLSVTTACFQDTESGTHATTSSVASSNCSSLSVNAFDVTTGTVSSYSQASIWADAGTDWNGMAANPSSI